MPGHLPGLSFLTHPTSKVFKCYPPFKIQPEYNLFVLKESSTFLLPSISYFLVNFIAIYIYCLLALFNPVSCSVERCTWYITLPPTGKLDAHIILFNSLISVCFARDGPI